MTSHPKRPREPLQPLTVDDSDLEWHDGPLWRVHRTTGPHVLGWDILRGWGPVAGCRWDPHPEPPADHPGDGVMYTATDLATAVVEVFGNTRRIDPNTGNPRATSWEPGRPLRLLNLTDDWFLRNGASASLASAPHSTCRAWARAIRRTFPDLDGLWTISVLTGRANVVLWAPAADTFPVLPAFTERLDSDLMWDTLDRLAVRYGNADYRLI